MTETINNFLTLQEKIVSIAQAQYATGSLFKNYNGLILMMAANQTPLELFSVSGSSGLNARYRPIEQHIGMALTLNHTTYALNESYLHTELGLQFVNPAAAWMVVFKGEPVPRAQNIELFKNAIEILSNIVPPTPPTPTV